MCFVLIFIDLLNFYVIYNWFTIGCLQALATVCVRHKEQNLVPGEGLEG